MIFWGGGRPWCCPEFCLEQLRKPRPPFFTIRNMTTPLRTLTSIGLAIATLSTAATAAEQIVDFVAMQQRADSPAPVRWNDPDTGAVVFNLDFTPQGAIKGGNYLPGSIEMYLPTEVSEIKLSLKFMPGSKGVAAVTLTSRDGRQRLRFQYNKSGLTLAWRDRRVEEAAIQFRQLTSFPSEDSKAIDIVMDLHGDQITITDGEVTDVVKANENGAPDIQVGELEKVIVSVEGDSILQELKITDK